MSNPIFSIITATYNRVELLKKAAKSVFNQTLGDFEWIIINDGSLDETKAVISSFKDERVKFYNFSKNKGVLVAKRKGLQIAKGKYVIGLDDDDELLPNALQSFLNIWEQIQDKNISTVCMRCLNSNTGNKIGFLKKDNLVLNYIDMLGEKKVKGDFANCFLRNFLLNVPFDKKMQNICGFEFIINIRLAKKYNFFYKDIPVKLVNVVHSSYPRLTNSKMKNICSLTEGYEIFLYENGEILKKYHPDKYLHYLKACIVYNIVSGNKGRGRKLSKNVLKRSFSLYFIGLYVYSFLPLNIIKNIFQLRLLFQNFFKRHN